MRTTIVLAAVVGILTAGCTGDGFERNPQHPVFDPKATSWEEDMLPTEMYEWVDKHGGDLKPARRTIEGHKGCWMAIADTTLVMCPDGFKTTS